MKTSTRFASGLLLCAGLLASVPASTQVSGFAGTFNAADSQAATVDQAIESAVAQMSFVARPIARSRLKKTNVAYQRIRLSQDAGVISIQFDERPPVQMPADGSAAKWTRDDGEVFDVSAREQAGVLVQTFKAEDGERRNEFSLSPNGGTLTLEVTLTSPRLPTPVKYSLTFRRQLDRKNPHLEFTGGDR